MLQKRNLVISMALALASCSSQTQCVESLTFKMYNKDAGADVTELDHADVTELVPSPYAMQTTPEHQAVHNPQPAAWQPQVPLIDEAALEEAGKLGLRSYYLNLAVRLATDPEYARTVTGSPKTKTFFEAIDYAMKLQLMGKAVEDLQPFAASRPPSSPTMPDWASSSDRQAEALQLQVSERNRRAREYRSGEKAFWEAWWGLLIPALAAGICLIAFLIWYDNNKIDANSELVDSSSAPRTSTADAVN